MDYKNRYQNKPWYIRMWRRRWMLLVPFSAVWSWITFRVKYRSFQKYKNGSANKYETFKVVYEDWLMEKSFGFHWDIALSKACQRMLWFYTMEEVEDNHILSKNK